MTAEKQFAKEQLIALHNEIRELKDSFEPLDEVDHEYKRGMDEAFYKVANIIFVRYKELMNEQK